MRSPTRAPLPYNRPPGTEGYLVSAPVIGRRVLLPHRCRGGPDADNPRQPGQPRQQRHRHVGFEYLEMFGILPGSISTSTSVTVTVMVRPAVISRPAVRSQWPLRWTGKVCGDPLGGVARGAVGGGLCPWLRQIEPQHEVLDFVWVSGPELTVGSTIFEM